LIIDNDHKRIGEWIAKKTDSEYREGSKCIGLEKDGEIIAGVLYDWFNGSSVYAHIAIEGPINREFLWFIFYYPFEQLGAKVIIGLVAEDNKKAQQLDEHLGFVLNSIIPQGHPSGGLFIYTMNKNQCRWLNVKAKSSEVA
jgi:RimJ/RimL family protein N-acetyltransferase